MRGEAHRWSLAEKTKLRAWGVLVGDDTGMSRPDGGRGEEAGELGVLYDAHAVGLYRYALMILADPSEAEDAVHQVFARLVRRDGRLRPLESGSDYLRAAVRNECFTVLRRRRRRREGERTGILESVSPASGDDERLMVETGLRALSAEQREVVYLKVYEGMTFEEIGRATSTPANTAASRYRYALAHLRDRLRGDDGGGTNET